MAIDGIFRKYDIRGKFGSEFTTSDVYPIGQAIASYLKSKNNKLKNIALAMDGRSHSPLIKKELTKALLDSGLDVTFIGICPSPVLYFSNYYNKYNFDAGIMITASHNPSEYNGLKIILNKSSIWDKDLENIKNLYKENLKLDLKTKNNFSNNPGKYSELDICDDYINYLANKFKNLKNNKLNFVIDSGNSAPAVIIPKLIKKLNLSNVKLLCSKVDSENQLHQADPTKLKNMLDVKDTLLNNKNLAFGVGLDGDGDRVGVMTKSGDLISGDKLLTIFAEYLKKEKKLKKLNIVADINYSSHLKDYLVKNNINLITTPCGHAYLKAAMKKEDCPLGGELSGHFCFRDKYLGFDDGIYALLRLCEIIVNNNINLEDILAKLPKISSSPEIRIKCKSSAKSKIIIYTKSIFAAKKEDFNLITIDGIRIESKSGWGILRASNTEDVISVRFEGLNPESLVQIKTKYFEALKKFFDQDFLKKELNL